MKNVIILFMILVQYGCASNSKYYYNNNQKTELIPLDKSTRAVSTNVVYYKNDRGIVLGITDTLLVKLKDSQYLQSILNEFNLSLEKKLGKNLYLLKTLNKDLTIDISNQLSQKHYILYAHPDFIKKNISR